jgi:hypothetical protein
MSATYLQPKDPSEVADYSYSFASAMGEGVTLTGHAVTLTTAAGTSKVTDGRTPEGVVTFRLSGGNHLETAALDINATLSDGQVLNAAVLVPVVDNASAVTVTEVDRITAEMTAVRAARSAFIAGGAVKQAWSGRYGNRMTYDNPTLKDYNDMIVMLQRDLEAAENVEAGLPARGRIGIRWAS